VTADAGDVLARQHSSGSARRIATCVAALARNGRRERVVRERDRSCRSVRACNHHAVRRRIARECVVLEMTRRAINVQMRVSCYDVPREIVVARRTAARHRAGFAMRRPRNRVVARDTRDILVPRLSEIRRADLQRHVLAFDAAHRVCFGVAVLAQGVRRDNPVHPLNIRLAVALPARAG